MKEGKIRMVARGSDVPSLRGQTVRAIIVNTNSLKTKHDAIMKFIEMSGHTLFKIVSPQEAEPLHKAGVTDSCLLRVNLQGDVEIRRRSEWGIIGGMLGDFDARIKKATGLEWA